VINTSGIALNEDFEKDYQILKALEQNKGLIALLPLFHLTPA
jgi:hypothetical protein